MIDKMTYEKFRLDYSMKNIPLSDRREYKLQLLQKTKEFMRRMRIKSNVVRMRRESGTPLAG